MPHATLTIDGHTVLDHDLTGWQQQPPEQLLELISKTRTETRPWFKAAMMPLTEAFIQHEDVAITVQTHTRGWTLTVDHPQPDALAG